MITPAFVFNAPGGGELMILLAIGVLLFGGRLPEIMRNLGKGVVEFRKGLHGLSDEPAQPTTPQRAAIPDHREEDEEASGVPKFQLPDD